MTRNNITKEIFEGKYPSKMNYDSYLSLLEEGNFLLNSDERKVTECKELSELKAIRIALEYRLEVIRQFRKNQLRSLGRYAEAC